MKCGIVENRKGKILPACKIELVDDKRPTYQCRVHCRSKLRGERKGRLCSNRHVKGKRGCRMHGGTKKVGIAAPNKKTLKYSRYVNVLGPEAKAKFQEVMRQSNVLSLLPDIYMLDMQIETWAARLTSESSADWREAMKAFEQFVAASDAKNKKGQVEALTILGAVLRRGSQRIADNDSLVSLQNQRLKLISAERRHRLEHSVHKGVVYQLIDALQRSIERNVEDAVARERVGADIARFTGATVVTENQTNDLGQIG